MIDAPSDLGLKPTGVSGLPEALREAGLFEGLDSARYDGRIPVPPYRPERDPDTGVLNAAGIAAVARALADRVRAVIARREFPIVLGGDCSILLGPMLALRKRGRYGLLFIDGHADFYSPAVEPNGEVASMELAIVTGREPASLANLDDKGPLVRDEDVVVFGHRDAETAARYGSPDVAATHVQVLDLAAVRELGAAAAAERAVATLARAGSSGFWIHLDADVLNDSVMPAVDYRMPGGLWPDELQDVLHVALPMAAGLDVTIYNPKLDDAARSAGNLLAGLLRTALWAAR